MSIIQLISSTSFIGANLKSLSSFLKPPLGRSQIEIVRQGDPPRNVDPRVVGIESPTGADKT